MIRNFTPFPVLETERLILRQIEPEDANIVFDLRRNEIVNKFLLRAIPETVESVLKIIENLNKGIAENLNIYWVLNLKPDKKVIGTICLWNFSDEKNSADLGYELHPDFQKKGLMLEAVEKILEYGFDEMKLERIEAWTSKENLSSVKILEKNNFVRDFEAESRIDKKIEGEDAIIYSLENKN